MNKLQYYIEKRLYEDIGGNNITLQPSSEGDERSLLVFAKRNSLLPVRKAIDTRGDEFLIFPLLRESKEGVDTVRKMRKIANFVDVTGNNLTPREEFEVNSNLI